MLTLLDDSVQSHYYVVGLAKKMQLGRQPRPGRLPPRTTIIIGLDRRSDKP